MSTVQTLPGAKHPSELVVKRLEASCQTPLTFDFDTFYEFRLIIL